MSAEKGSAATRQKLLRAAAEEITERGYAGASLARIAARIGLTKGAFAHHYPTKRDILVDLSAAMDAVLVESRDVALAAQPEGGIPALVVFLGTVGRRTVGDPIGTAAITLVTDIGATREGLPDGFTQWIDTVATFLESARDLGQYVPRDRPTALYEGAESIVTAMVGITLYYRQHPDRAPEPPLQFLRIVLRGIGVGEADALVDSVLPSGDEYSVVPRFTGEPTV